MSVGRHASLTPNAIAMVIQTFYGRVQHDAVLGPIFARHVTDWAPHLLRSRPFGGASCFARASFSAARGAPPDLHAAIEDLAPEHFARWLTLCSDVWSACLATDPARHSKVRAHAIGESLQRRIAPAKESSPGVC
jgi:hemoglobin